jgi:hypothetical protein
MSTRSAINPDTLAELEEERRFLLRSLTDLEREYEAGDVDRHDYEVLRDGYTARAAAVMRTIDAGVAALPPKRRTRPAVLAAWIVGVLVVASVSGWLVARSSGQRLAGQSMTGGAPANEVAVLLTEARALMATDPGAAFDRFQQVTALEPDNVEARTYSAWMLVISSRSITDDAQRRAALDAARVAFESVTADDPTYADAHCLYAVAAGAFFDPTDADLARAQGDECLASNPPTEIRGLVEPFLAQLDASSTSTGETTLP